MKYFYQFKSTKLFYWIISAVLFFPMFLFAQEEQTLTVGSTTRQMIVYAPAGIPKDRPLVISMHGMSQTMYDQLNQTSFQSVADANRFILVYPQSIGTMWDLNGTSDIDFILAIINEMYKRYDINRDRVYLSGFSMGGMMCYYAATKIADKIAAFAPVSGFLMSGPNAVSSRPIPIIHIHGMNDNFVPYSNVQTHIDAWVKRNGCPPAVVTNPFSDMLSVKKYYGPGKEGVEVVFIGVNGVDHWYSNGTGGVVSSQEIWNFCSRYSLKIGVPEFVSAAVSGVDPKQIKLTLSTSIADSVNFKGFTVKVNNQSATINDVVLSDSNKLTINLQNNVLNSDEILLSYNNGNVLSQIGKKLANFNDTVVNNLLTGSLPQIIEATTNVGGDTLRVRFNKKMLLPASLDGLELVSVFNGNQTIPVQKCAVSKGDSATLIFNLGQKVYRDYHLFFSNSGTSFVSTDNGVLKSISNLSVTNIANGLPATAKSAKLNADGLTLDVKFSKPMLLTSAQLTSMAIIKNFTVRSVVKAFSVQDSSILFKLTDAIHYGDTVRVTYVSGTVKAEDNGALTAFTRLAAQSDIQSPNWITIPGKIEAENFTFKSGMQAETTTDTGGGQNMGYIATGDWTEYAIDNTSTGKNFQILFRLSAQSAGGAIDYYLDGVKAGGFNVPATGDWQTYQSTTVNLAANPGKHYLKVVVKTTGFNFNYMDVSSVTGLKPLEATNLKVFFNATTNNLEIKTNGFDFDKIEVFDMMGKLLLSKASDGMQKLSIQVAIPAGVYLAKLSNATQFQVKKFAVAGKK
ncbi:MAG: carbohydrate-binding protein [Paludibacter sp.]|nr:carbohydrate-binding protein [Paludibacter sp.]